MRKLIFTILIAAGCLQAAAERTVPFFDTSRPNKVIALGLRAGMNSSGVATNYMDKQPELIQSNFYWHSGVQVGAIADLSIRKFLAIEVGLFWERHGYDAAMMAATAEEDYMGSQFTRVRYNDIHIPVLMSWRFNILPQAVWSVDLGPYFSYGLWEQRKPTPTLHSARRTDNWCLTTTSAIKNISKPTRKTSLPSTASTPA